jgi:glycosyltransferase involved in cell wall biosynthesis
VTTLRHVGLNAVFLQPRMGGLETYVRRLIPELLALRPDVRFTLFVSQAGRRELAGEEWAGEVTLVAHPLVGRRYVSALSEALLLDPLARRAGVDLLHSVAMTGPLRAHAVHVVTIGDLIWLRNVHRSDRATVLTWKLLVPRVAKRATRIITFSEASRHDIQERLGIEGGRVDVVPPGAGQGAGGPATDPAELRTRFGLDGARVVLTVSAKRPHKNLGRLLEALPRIRELVPDAVLVMPGNPTAHEEELRRLAESLAITDAVRFPPYVTAEELEGLYAIAECFVFPSLLEGFGLPILEAMRRSVPVVAADASSLPEVAGEAARYFDPLDAACLAEAVIEVMTQPDLARRLVEAGRERHRAFTWLRCGEETLAAYERAWHEGRP